MEINGYIKLIGHSVENENQNYDFYIENEDSILYKISISYNKSNSTGDIKNFNLSACKVNPSDIILDKHFYLPKNISDVLLKQNTLEGNITPKGCNIGDILEFNKNFVMVFNEQMFPISDDKVYDMISLNKDNFIEIVDNINNISRQTIEIIEDDLYNEYEQLKLDNDEFHIKQDISNVKVRTDKYGNRLNAFGNYADYDDIR